MGSNYSVDDGSGTNLCGGLTREAARREAQQHANKTGLACLVYGDDYEQCIEPEEPEDDADADGTLADAESALGVELDRALAAVAARKAARRAAPRT